MDISSHNMEREVSEREKRAWFSRFIACRSDYNDITLTLTEERALAIPEDLLFTVARHPRLPNVLEQSTNERWGAIPKDIAAIVAERRDLPSILHASEKERWESAPRHILEKTLTSPFLYGLLEHSHHERWAMIPEKILALLDECDVRYVIPFLQKHHPVTLQRIREAYDGYEQYFPEDAPLFGDKDRQIGLLNRMDGINIDPTIKHSEVKNTLRETLEIREASEKVLKSETVRNVLNDYQQPIADEIKQEMRVPVRLYLFYERRWKENAVSAADERELQKMTRRIGDRLANPLARKKLYSIGSETEVEEYMSTPKSELRYMQTELLGVPRGKDKMWEFSPKPSTATVQSIIISLLIKNRLLPLEYIVSPSYRQYQEKRIASQKSTAFPLLEKRKKQYPENAMRQMLFHVNAGIPREIDPTDERFCKNIKRISNMMTLAHANTTRLKEHDFEDPYTVIVGKRIERGDLASEVLGKSYIGRIDFRTGQMDGNSFHRYMADLELLYSASVADILRRDLVEQELGEIWKNCAELYDQRMKEHGSLDHHFAAITAMSVARNLLRITSPNEKHISRLRFLYKLGQAIDKNAAMLLHLEKEISRQYESAIFQGASAINEESYRSRAAEYIAQGKKTRYDMLMIINDACRRVRANLNLSSSHTSYA